MEANSLDIELKKAELKLLESLFCETCGELALETYYGFRGKEGFYCSRECLEKAKTCENCGATMKNKIFFGLEGRTYCSLNCMREKEGL